MGGYVGPPSALPFLWTCRLLRLLKKQTRHQTFQNFHHLLICSIEPGEAWLWCYVDEISPGELDVAS